MPGKDSSFYSQMVDLFVYLMITLTLYLLITVLT
jgi:hypothetical protein